MQPETPWGVRLHKIKNELAIIAPFALLIYVSTYSLVLSKDPVNTAIVSPDELTKELNVKRDAVHEFREIRTLAEKHGLKVWLFGGTAAAFAHYVKWDTARRNGDNRYLPNRFDYDFTSIFRSTQDMDLVADGSAEKIEKFKEELQEKFPYFVGSKEQWEVRSLREKMGDKEALLNNPDFLNQNTDSNSTGMIEMTRSGASIKDLRDWNGAEPQFLRDVAEGKIHFYHSELHKTTSRFREGKNPEIISVIRYLTKIAQFDAEPREEDLAVVKKIIEAFDPMAAIDKYVKGWLEKNGAKLFKHATNVEAAWNLIDRLGLRKKLIAISDPTKEGTLGWWLNKEPLRSGPVGKGTGRTIADIAKLKRIPIAEFQVTHETRNFLAYESLTRDTTGQPNVFISRGGETDEAARYGDGHYTKIGGEGARGTGISVRYLPDPEAREGTDFVYVPEHDFIVWKNKSALKVIPESLDISIRDYFERLSKGTLFGAADKGVEEKLRRKMKNKGLKATPREQAEIYEIVRKAIDSLKTVPLAFFRAWFELPWSNKFPDVVEKFLSTKRWETDKVICDSVLAHPHWNHRPDWIKRIIDREEATPSVLVSVLSQKHWSDYPELAKEIMTDYVTPMDIPKYLFGTGAWIEHPELVEYYLKQHGRDSSNGYFLIADGLSNPLWSRYPYLLVPLIESGKHDEELNEHLFSVDEWKKNPDLVRISGGQSPTAELLRAKLKELKALAPKTCQRAYGNFANK